MVKARTDPLATASVATPLNQEPIGEQGGLNLYGFCGNNAVNRWDYLGQHSWAEQIAQSIWHFENLMQERALTPEEWAEYGYYQEQRGMVDAYEISVNTPSLGGGGAFATFNAMFDALHAQNEQAQAAEAREKAARDAIARSLTSVEALAAAWNGTGSLPTYTVTYDPEHGVSSGWVGGQRVGYLYDSGFGSTLDQITQRWSDFTPSTPSNPNAEPSAPNSIAAAVNQTIASGHLTAASGNTLYSDGTIPFVSRGDEAAAAGEGGAASTTATSQPGYWDRYAQHVENYAITLPAVASVIGVVGGSIPKTWVGRQFGPNPLTSFVRGIFGSNPVTTAPIVRQFIVPVISVASAAVGGYNTGVLLSGFVYAAFPGSNGLPPPPVVRKEPGT
jgi:hypothetical protein